MLLYDVFYPKSNGFDRNIPLPKKAPNATEAINTNWDKKVLVRKNNKWIEKGC